MPSDISGPISASSLEALKGEQPSKPPADHRVLRLTPDALRTLQPLLTSLPITSESPAPRKKAILGAFKGVVNACDKYNAKSKGKKNKQSIDLDGANTADWLDSEGE